MMGWLLGIPILIIIVVSTIKVSFIFGTLNSGERDDVLRKMREVVGLLMEYTKRIFLQLIGKSKNFFSTIFKWLNVKYRGVCSKLKRQKRIVIGNFEPRNKSVVKHL